VRVWRFIQPLLCESSRRVLAKTDKLISSEQPRCWRRNHRIRLARNFSDLSKWNSAPRNDRGTEVVIRGGQISFYFRSVSTILAMCLGRTRKWIEWGWDKDYLLWRKSRPFGNSGLGIDLLIPGEVKTIQLVANGINREDFSPVHLRCEHQNSKSRYILDNSALDNIRIKNSVSLAGTSGSESRFVRDSTQSAENVF